MLEPDFFHTDAAMLSLHCRASFFSPTQSNKCPYDAIFPGEDGLGCVLGGEMSPQLQKGFYHGVITQLREI